MAAESDDPKEMAAATRQIINNCVLDEGFDCLDLPIFDADYIFMHIRAKSVGEKIKQNYTCNNKVNGVECGSKFSIEINLNEVQLVRDESIKDQIYLTPELGVKMKYPSYKITSSILDSDNDLDQTLKTLYGSIEYIFDKDQTYQMKETSYDEFLTFINDLTKDQFEKLTGFIESTPYFEIKKEHKCEKCGFLHEFKFDDPLSFF